MLKTTIEVTFPNWVKFTTVDNCGVIEIWEQKPYCDVKQGRWLPVGGHHKEFLQYDSQSFKGWKNSLRERRSIRD